VFLVFALSFFEGGERHRTLLIDFRELLSYWQLDK
jgi:hypothetical protein